MRKALALAKASGVRPGAHPGLSGAAGREPRPLSAPEFETLLIQQIGALEMAARLEKTSLTHVKLHGALYHMTESSSILRRAYVDAIRECRPNLIVYAMAGGAVARSARRAGLNVWEEAFIDRRYATTGQLVNRSALGAILIPSEAVEQARLLLDHQEVRLVQGQTRPLRARTFCIHSDTPFAPKIARTLGPFFKERAKAGGRRSR